MKVTMPLISSEALAEKGIDVRPDGQIDFGERMIGTSNIGIELIPEHSQQIADIARVAIGHMPDSETTLVRRKCNLPTLVSRVDCTLGQDDTIYPYEVDDRPAGLGVSHRLMVRAGHVLNPAIHKHYCDTVGERPVVIRFPSVQPNDDAKMFSVFEPGNIPEGVPVLIRSKLEDPVLAELYDRVVDNSVAPIMAEGDKTYRIPMGHAVHVDADYEHDPSVPVVAKNMQGTRCNGVGIYLPPAQAAMYGGDSVMSHAELQRLVRRVGPSGMLMERFVPPIPTALGKRYGGTILRVYVAHESTGNVSVLGGSYVSRPGPLVHGTEDALAGPVVIG